MRAHWGVAIPLAACVAVLPLRGLAAPLAVVAEVTTNRPASWALPIELAGVPNLFKLSDDLYRCAQPTPEGMRSLKRIGVKTVLNLRSFHSDTDELRATGLASESIPMKAWHPEKEDLLRFLRLATDTNRTPVVVHCQHGADRTGTMCAVYRMVVQGWTADEAIDELREGGFGFHRVWRDLIAFIRQVDVEEMRAKAGIKPPPSATPPAPQ